MIKILGSPYTASDTQTGEEDLGLRLAVVGIALFILVARDIRFAHFSALCKSKATLSSYTSLTAFLLEHVN